MAKSMKDFGKDRSSRANLPQEVHMVDYPKQSGLGGEIDDTITGIDECVKQGIGQAKKYISNQK
jgi:hypothetical protein